MTRHITGIRRARPIGLRVALLLSVVLWVLILSLAAALAQTGAVQKETITERAAQFVRTDAPTMNALVQAAAAAMAEAALQTAKAQAAVLVSPPPAAPSLPAPVAAAPPSAVAAAPSTAPPQPDPVLQQIALAAVPVVGALMIPLLGWGMTIFSKRTGIEITAEQKAAVYAAVQTGKGSFLANLAAGSAQLADAKEGSLLIKSLASDAMAAVPDAVSAQGVDHDHMARLIHGAIGNAISADPTIPTLAASVKPEVVAVVQPPPPLAVVEAAATPQSPPPA